MSNAEDPRELARRLAEEARAKAAAAPAKASSGKASSRVAKFAKGKASKALSAQEALKAAIAAEQSASEDRAAAVRAKAKAKQQANEDAKKVLARAEAAKAKASKPKAKAKAEPDTDSQAAAPAKAAPKRPSTKAAVTSPGELLTKRLPAFRAERIVTIERREAFRGVWAAHRTRAGVEQDASMLATADMLLDAAKRLPPRAFHAARVTAEDGAAWAVFVDTASGSLLAAVTPADVYLVGLR